MKRVCVELPELTAARIEHEAKRLAITRKALLRLWLDEKLQSLYPKGNPVTHYAPGCEPSENP